MSRKENDFDSCENNEVGGKLFGNQKHYFGSWADYVGMLELRFRMIFAGGKFYLPGVKNWGNILFHCCNAKVTAADEEGIKQRPHFPYTTIGKA